MKFKTWMILGVIPFIFEAHAMQNAHHEADDPASLRASIASVMSLLGIEDASRPEGSTATQPTVTQIMESSEGGHTVIGSSESRATIMGASADYLTSGPSWPDFINQEHASSIREQAASGEAENMVYVAVLRRHVRADQEFMSSYGAPGSRPLAEMTTLPYLEAAQRANEAAELSPYRFSEVENSLIRRMVNLPWWSSRQFLAPSTAYEKLDGVLKPLLYNEGWFPGHEEDNKRIRTTLEEKYHYILGFLRTLREDRFRVLQQFAEDNADVLVPFTEKEKWEVRVIQDKKAYVTRRSEELWALIQTRLEDLRDVQIKESSGEAAVSQE